ncbi:MAG TPA: class II glutamine amidotransferase [Verrucomicrobiae bacterium]|jgi:glutamine amidotransferase|nr:class II glutamine amidotransferase [Verrucomicrobiae bacterium]
MCQLLGMNCNYPTDICFSFQGFAARGGRTDNHQDGWGIAFFEGTGCRLFLDNRPSIYSPIADLVLRYPIHATHVIAHIRRASVGPVAIENCHPFQRELWGRYWVFAHNGDVPGLHAGDCRFYKPVGQTDSERAFCLILDALRTAFPAGGATVREVHAVLKEITQSIAAHGIFNYLLSDGNFFFAHSSNNLCYVVRQSPFSSAHLIDQDLSVDFQALARPTDRVSIIATAPLTDNETWTPMKPGELLAFENGVPLKF